MSFFKQAEEEDKSSMFNQAGLQMKRLDEEIKRINQCKIDPLAFNIEFNTYNYQVIFMSIKNIFLEIIEKLKPNEEEKILLMIRGIGHLLEHNPPYKIVKTKVYPYKTKVKFDANAWRILDRYIFNFDLKIRKLMEQHGYGSPLADDPRSAMMR